MLHNILFLTSDRYVIYTWPKKVVRKQYLSTKATLQEFTKPYYFTFYLNVLRSDSGGRHVCALYIVLEWIKDCLIRWVFG